MPRGRNTRGRWAGGHCPTLLRLGIECDAIMHLFWWKSSPPSRWRTVWSPVDTTIRHLHHQRSIGRWCNCWVLLVWSRATISLLERQSFHPKKQPGAWRSSARGQQILAFGSWKLLAVEKLSLHQLPRAASLGVDFSWFFLHATGHVHLATPPWVPPGQLARTTRPWHRRICVVTCLLTLRSLSVLRHVPQSCSRSNTRQRTLAKPASALATCLDRCHSVSFDFLSVNELTR